MTNSGHNPIPDSNDGAGTTPNDRVEWSRNTILQFIEDYRCYRVLWDPNTKGYHIKQIKYEALKKLSRKYDTEVRIIRSKIKSLRSSFHREHGKVISGKRRGIKYQPMWFAYEAIRFILDGERDDMGGSSGYDGASNGCGSATAVVTTAGGADTAAAGIDANGEMMTLASPNEDPHYATISAEDVKTELASIFIANSNMAELTVVQLQVENGGIEDVKPTVQQTTYDRLIKKRKRRISRSREPSSHQLRSDSESDDCHSSPFKSNRQSGASGSDEFGIFGEYVGVTIRKLKTSKAQVVIKHLINNLLYDAEMGRYDYGIPTSRDPPHLYATAD